MHPNSGIFLSATTNIDSSLFGISPDPFEQKFGIDSDPLSDGVIKESSSPSSANLGSDQAQAELYPNSNSPIGFLKNMVYRLGVKFGYYKKPQPHPDVVHDFQEEEEYFEFMCMTADDQPILVDNIPVTVNNPEDCSQYFQADLPKGHATLLEPPKVFMDSARTIFKSK